MIHVTIFQNKYKECVGFQTEGPVSTSSQLLLKSLVLGLNGIQDEYGKKHIKIRLEKQEG